MNPVAMTTKALKAACTGALGLGLTLTLSNCNRADGPLAPTDSQGSQVTREALTPTRVDDNESQAKSSAAAVSVHFGDRTACQWNPEICQFSWVFNPGYIQSGGGSNWIYAMQSNGPWTLPVGPESHIETNRHFHIIGLMNPAMEPNPYHTAMRGNWWTWFGVKRNNARVNFDLTQINVLGNVPIRIWFKDSAGNGWQWSSLGPGRWNLPGATNIQEVHISSASGLTADIFRFDDVVITPR